MFDLKGKYTTAKVTLDYIEEACMSQIISFLNHPVFTGPVAIMPDTHAGKGSVVGFTMPLGDKIIPNIVGVDVGCGMTSICIGSYLGMDLALLDHKIRQQVPFGFSTNEKAILDMKKDFPWREACSEAQKFALAYQEKFGTGITLPHYDMEWFEKKCAAIGCDLGRAIKSIGSLGGGNHFIEVGKAQNTGAIWITIHTGSRNFGKCICEYWQDKAIKKVKKQSKEDSQKIIKELKANYTGKELFERIKAFKNTEVTAPEFSCSDELRWLEGEDAQAYLFDMVFAQIYAEQNRAYIASTILDILDLNDPNSLYMIETVHNFIDFKDFIIRKGAIRSYVGEQMVIPFNMRDGILVCEGKSNPDWNFSAPHGAGRVLSRSQAKKKLNMDEFKDQMKDVYSTSVCPGTLDEAPDAYKDSKLIEEAIGPTATIIDRIKPILNMKATEKEEE